MMYERAERCGLEKVWEEQGRSGVWESLAVPVGCVSRADCSFPADSCPARVLALSHSPACRVCPGHPGLSFQARPTPNCRLASGYQRSTAPGTFYSTRCPIPYQVPLLGVAPHCISALTRKDLLSRPFEPSTGSAVLLCLSPSPQCVGTSLSSLGRSGFFLS